MSSRRTVVTTLVMLFATGLVLAMMGMLWVVGQDLLRLKEARSDLASGLEQAEKAVGGLRADVSELCSRLEDAKLERRRLAGDLKMARTRMIELVGELGEARRRLKALEEGQRPAVAPPRVKPPGGPAAPPDPGPPVHPAELPPAERDKPAALFQAASRALQEKGIAGFCTAIGLEEAAQARFRKAYEGFLPQVLAAERAHAKVATVGDAVEIAIEPYHKEGHVLLTAWQGLLAQALTPAEQKAYADARGDVVLFQRPFGHYTQTVTLARDAMGVKFSHRGSRVGMAGVTFESAGTVSGAGAVDRLPWRHLLGDEAAAKLRGAAAEP